MRAQVEFTPFEVPQQDLLVDTVLMKKVDTRPVTEISRELLLRTLEQAYPNVLSLDELFRCASSLLLSSPLLSFPFFYCIPFFYCCDYFKFLHTRTLSLTLAQPGILQFNFLFLSCLYAMFW